jgi:hypothetical protein
MDSRGLFILFEQGRIGSWVRESPSLLAFPTVIALHAVGMGLLAGTNAAMDFRLLGFARGIRLSALKKLVPTMRFGFWLNAVSGVLLLLAYSRKHLQPHICQASAGELRRPHFQSPSRLFRFAVLHILQSGAVRQRFKKSRLADARAMDHSSRPRGPVCFQSRLDSPGRSQ